MKKKIYILYIALEKSSIGSYPVFEVRVATYCVNIASFVEQKALNSFSSH